MFVERLDFEFLSLQTVILALDFKPSFKFSILAIYNQLADWMGICNENGRRYKRTVLL